MPALPTHLPDWDVFGVNPGAEMHNFGGYADVQLIGDGSHFLSLLAPPADSGDFVIKAGPSSALGTGHVYMSVSVPDQNTLEATFYCTDLPNDFTDIPGDHVFIGSVDQNGCCAGLFFAKTGISYTGDVNFIVDVLHLNSPVQFLPNSLNLFNPGTQYTLRIIVDSVAKVTYVYITETALVGVIGQQLKFVLPGLLTDDGLVNPGDEIVLSVGSVSTDRELHLSSLYLGTGLHIPNLPPIADPGRDQAIRSCTIARFDGRASFDPEGAPVSYSWRLIDGPDASTFVHPGHDGILTGPSVDRLYSLFLYGLTGSESPEVGDVLLVAGVPYNIINKFGTGASFYVQIDGTYLNGPAAAVDFRLLKQSAISNRADAQPSFYPDVPGLFRFDLVVFDGLLYSLPANMLVNVTDSPVPRGITPDITFLWDYISDFWSLVDNTEVIETFWSSLAQIAASELLTLWQHDYGKSLRDIQRTFQRKWLHYDSFMRDPFPATTVVDHIYGGVEFPEIPTGGIPLSIAPSVITVSSPLFPDTDVFISPAGANLLSSEFRDQLFRQLKGIYKSFEVNEYSNVGGTSSRVQVTAPFYFSMTSVVGGVTFFFENGLPFGTGGAAVGVNTYVVENRVDNVGVKEDDFLILEGVAYRITRVVTDPADAWAGRRLVLKDSIPIAPSATWKIARGCSSKFLDYYTSLCSAGDKAVIELENLLDLSMNFVEVDVLSAAPDNNSRLLIDTNKVAPYLCQPDTYAVLLYAVYRRTYFPVEPLVVGVPTMQELIKNTDDSAVLRQNVDYYREEFRGKPCLRFLTRANSSVDVWQDALPPPQMWAEVTYIDNRPTIEGNFGLPAAFTLDDLSKLPSSADYLSIVQGLWYLYFTGPTLYNLRAGTQILLGLPFAEVDGIIAEIRNDFTSSTGRILVTDATEAAIVRSYTFPAILPLETNPTTGKPYAVGDKVKQFAPLVEGVEVTDYLKNPTWFQGYLNQGVFYEVEKFFKFLVRIDSAAFSLNTLVFVKSFINRIKPTYTYPLYVVLYKVPDTTVDVNDDVFYTGHLSLNEWIGSFNYAGGPFGFIGGFFDDPHAAFGGWRQAFDSDGIVYGDTPSPAPTYPTATSPIHWGYDREALSPCDVIVGTLSGVYGAPFNVAYDGLFQMDMPAFDEMFGIFSGGYSQIPTSATPIILGDPQIVGVGGTLNEGIFIFRGIYPLTAPTPVMVQVLVNNAPVMNIPLTLSAVYEDMYPTPITPLVLNPGDVVKVLFWSTGSAIPLPGGAKIFVALGHGSTWAFDTLLPAGTYYSPRLM